MLTHTQTEYRVVPDARRPTALEIYSINNVQATSPQAEVAKHQPFYSFKHGTSREKNTKFWNATRRPDSSAEGDDAWKSGTDVFLSLVDLDFTPASCPDWTVEVETTCLNRSLPRLLPFGGGRPELELPDGRGPVSVIRCLTPPTPTVRATLKHNALWKCISHLSLNHLSLSDNEEGADALREILRLYDLSDSPEVQNLLDGIISVKSRRVVGRAPGLPGAFCRGLEVQLVLDENKFQGSAPICSPACSTDSSDSMCRSIHLPGLWSPPSSAQINRSRGDGRHKRAIWLYCNRSPAARAVPLRLFSSRAAARVDAGRSRRGVRPLGRGNRAGALAGGGSLSLVGFTDVSARRGRVAEVIGRGSALGNDGVVFRFAWSDGRVTATLHFALAGAMSFATQ